MYLRRRIHEPHLGAAAAARGQKRKKKKKEKKRNPKSTRTAGPRKEARAPDCMRVRRLPAQKSPSEKLRDVTNKN